MKEIRAGRLIPSLGLPGPSRLHAPTRFWKFGRAKLCRAANRFAKTIHASVILPNPGRLTKRGRSKSDSAEKKFRPPPPNRLQIPKVVTICRGIRPLPPIAIGRRRGVARREKARLLRSFGLPPIPSLRAHLA